MTKLNNDEAFRHVDYHFTDVRRTWARERKRLAELKAAQDSEAKAISVEQAVKIRMLRS